MIRKLTKVLVGLVVVLVVVVVALYLTIDSIAKAGIQSGGRYALGVDTRVSSVGVSLLGGKLTVSDLAIDNPKGYTAATLLNANRCEVDVKTRTLFSQAVEVPLVEIDGLNLNIERKEGKNNVSEISDHIKSLWSGQKKQGGRGVKIDKILLTNLTAVVQGVSDKPVTVKVARLELKDVTSDSAQGVVVSELMARLFPAIMASVLENGKGLIPADFANQMTMDVGAATKSLGEGASKLVGQAGDTGKSFQKMGQSAKDAATGIGKSFGDLFGKKKEEPK
jgi:hypothetical protein